MTRTFDSLVTHAQRRRRLAGGALIEGDHPWFIALDRLRSTFEQRGQDLVSFANYDYLGLGTDTRIAAAAEQTLRDTGIGALASRVVGGERSIHRVLERELADFIGAGDALVLVSGYLTNASLIAHLLGPDDLILLDELCHNSIMAGSTGSRAKSMVFRHNDLAHLDHLLASHRAAHRRCLIVVEGLYSMDGDVPDLQQLVALKERYSAWLMLDEAHSIGVLGATGRGLTEESGIDPAQIDLLIGTLSKTFVTSGGFVAGHPDVIQWLRFTLPGFVYSVGQSPVLAASALAALQILKEEPQRVDQLRRKATFFRDTALSLGLNVGESLGRSVVPILFSSTEETILASQALLEAGFYCPPVVQMGIPKDQPRLRFFISAAHEKDAMRRALELLAALRRTTSGAAVSSGAPRSLSAAE